ncbi:MAG: glycoside hydrolase family protein [Aeromonas veronii]
MSANAAIRKRVLAGLLSISAAGFATWMQSESFVSAPYVPTKGDVPTIGFGSTRYESGVRVTLADPPITRQRAAELARNLLAKDEARFRSSLPGVTLYQEEYDLYLDFVGQYGIGTWNKSAMRRHLLAGDYKSACADLLKYRFQDGRNCSLSMNWGIGGCKGVWTRQLARHAKCMDAQGGI